MCAAGTAEEMVCPGGEAAFVKQMLQDSLQLQATLKHLRALLHKHHVTALRTTTFVQVSMQLVVGICHLLSSVRH